MDLQTYHFEVLRSALGAVEVAGEQHVVDVVTGAVVELQHVEGSRLEIVEVGFDLQALQDILFHEMHVPDLIPGWKGTENEEPEKCFTHFKMQILYPLV